MRASNHLCAWLHPEEVTTTSNIAHLSISLGRLPSSCVLRRCGEADHCAEAEEHRTCSAYSRHIINVANGNARIVAQVRLGTVRNPPPPPSVPHRSWMSFFSKLHCKRITHAVWGKCISICVLSVCHCTPMCPPCRKRTSISPHKGGDRRHELVGIGHEPAPDGRPCTCLALAPTARRQTPLLQDPDLCNNEVRRMCN